MNSTYQRARPARLLLLLGSMIGIGLMFVGVGCFLPELFPRPSDGEDVTAVKFPYQIHEFDHELHEESLSCASCHHTDAGTASCSICHQNEWLGGVAKLKEAKHLTCRGCHDAMAGERVRCDTCHTGLNRLVAAEIDTDEDGVPDVSDNCPNTANPDQGDFDGDGIGDVCDVLPFFPNAAPAPPADGEEGDGVTPPADDEGDEPTPPADDDGDEPTPPPDDEDDEPIPPDDDGDDGEPLDGSALYSANCSACHGADGAGGFAPDITGGTAGELTAGLESASHGSISLTAEEIAAIAAFLGG